MDIAIFSRRHYEQESLQHAFANSPYQLHFFDVHLNASHAALAKGCEVVCAFVNDILDAQTFTLLATGGTRLIALRCAGYNNVDIQAAKQCGIQVVRVPAYSPHAVAEHACALLLSLNRHIHKAYNRVRDSNFSIEGLVGFDLHQKTVGVVGTGAIGTVFCQIMAGFGCHVLAYDPQPNAACREQGVEYVPLEQLLALSDIISLHCPLTPDTHHLINTHSLDLCKPGAVLINTSRGGLIDSHAVITALKGGKLSGLGIDVYEEEGDVFFEDLSSKVITDDVLMRLTTFPNVLMTGHQAFLTHEALQNIAQTTRANIDAYAANQPLANQVF
ncbi:MAG TPA: 2-hydroxyacid dehydrogenase [Pseudomonadales bacterium]|nr:2-hydroxyacid dehydrogenase [Pseudomonadales bacterium]